MVRKIAVRRAAQVRAGLGPTVSGPGLQSAGTHRAHWVSLCLCQVFYNNKGYHSMPTYLNSLNNAILRANLPKSKGKLNLGVNRTKVSINTITNKIFHKFY